MSTITENLNKILKRTCPVLRIRQDTRTERCFPRAWLCSPERAPSPSKPALPPLRSVATQTAALPVPGPVWGAHMRDGWGGPGEPCQSVSTQVVTTHPK